MSDLLRVAVDVGPLHGHRTGIGLATQHLVDALAAAGEVELLPYLVSYRARPEPPQRRVPVPAALAQRWWARLDGPKVDRWLGRPDVVHGTNYVVPPTRAPRLVSVYDCWFLTHTELATPDVQRAGHVLRRSVDRGAHVHASSHATAEVVRELLGTDRVTVVHLGPLDLDRTSPEPLPGLDGCPFVVAIGTVERRKGLPGLVEAFGVVAAELPDVRLVLAGAPGDDAEAVRRSVVALPAGVRERVLVPGAVSAGEKAWLLANAEVLAYPSLDEGFGFPLLEAQAAGLPIVATAAGSIPEVAGDGASLVPVGDTDALAAALVRAVTDDEHRRSLADAGRANVERFDWARTASAFVALYRSLVDEPRDLSPEIRYA
jgi:glycosyltransferase involved in cell wall biosynthesis